MSAREERRNFIIINLCDAGISKKEWDDPKILERKTVEVDRFNRVQGLGMTSSELE